MALSLKRLNAILTIIILTKIDGKTGEEIIELKKKTQG